MSGCPFGPSGTQPAGPQPAPEAQAGHEAQGAQGVSRRSFLRRSAGGAIVAAGVAAGLGGGITLERADAAGAETTTVPPFEGQYQGGIVSQPNRSHAVISLDVMTDQRSELTDFFKTLTGQVRRLATGGPVGEAFAAGIVPDNGILGPVIPGGQLAATVSLGASLFDDRFGLAPHKPRSLTTMKPFPNDNLDQAQCHGDISIQLEAADVDTVTHAVRRIMQSTDGVVQPRWRLDGFVNPPRPTGVPRNLFGFQDGISNPDVTDPAQMSSLIWAKRDGSEPAWTAGGTYLVVRIIRQLVEFWDRVSLQEQEMMIGRRRDSGAPLGTNDVNDTPDFAADPQGNTTPLTAHIRIANPRTAATADSRILRRALNYDRGLDVNGNLDMGLIFICYQQDIARQFEAVQKRLIDEPMVDYISPVGGGYFFTLPGITGPSDYYARGLLSA